MSADGVSWSAEVCVFEGLESVISHCTRWMENQTADFAKRNFSVPETNMSLPNLPYPDDQPQGTNSDPLPHHQHIEMYLAEPIVDRKSVFIGRACAITHPSEVRDYL